MNDIGLEKNPADVLIAMFKELAVFTCRAWSDSTSSVVTLRNLECDFLNLQ